MHRNDPPRLVVCEDDEVLARWIHQLAADANVEVVATTDSWSVALQHVVDADADAIVVDLASVGRLGMRLVRALGRLVPECRVLVISPFRVTDVGALEAGAAAVAGPTDLRPIATALRGLREPTPTAG